MLLASIYDYKQKLQSFIVKKMFIEIGFNETWALKNLLSNDLIFKEHVKIVKRYTVKFSAAIFNRLKIMEF